MSEARPLFAKPPRTDLARLHVVEADREHVAATWHNLFIVYWLGETTPGAVARLHQPVLRLASQHPERIGLLQVVGAATTAPSSDARAALAKLMKAAADVIACSSLVVPGVGFRMAAARALATGIVMIARPPFPHNVYATVEQAAEWQSSVLPRGDGAEISARDIINVVKSVQQKLPEQNKPK